MITEYNLPNDDVEKERLGMEKPREAVFTADSFG